MSIAMELDLARNMFGQLKPAIRKRLERYYADPSSAGWEDIYPIIVGSDRFMTMWQAWVETSPHAPRSHPHGEPWLVYPDRREFRTALEFATH